MSTILVVDDRKLNRDLFATILRYRHHEVLEAADGVDALALARTALPDLIISDILMPNMDGFELVRRLQQDESLKTVPVIFTSAHYLNQEAIALASRSGVRIVLSKPVEPEAFLAAVEAALSGQYAVKPDAPLQELSREHLNVLSSKLAEKVNELRGANALLTTLVEFGVTLGAAASPDGLAKQLSDAARRTVGARYATVGVFDDSRTALKRIAASGWAWSPEKGLGKGAAPQSLVARCLAAGRPLAATDLSGDPAAIGLPPSHPAARFALCAPIASSNRVYGWVCLADKVGTGRFSAMDEDLIGNLAAQVGRAHENAILLVRTQQRALDLEMEARRHEQTTAALRESDNRLRMIADTVPGLICMCDADGRNLFVNHGWTAYTGQTTSSERPTRMDEAVHPDDRPLLRDTMARAREEREPYSLEHRMRADAGDYRWFLHRGIPRFSGEGRFLGYVSVLLDVTEQRDLETQLRQAFKMDAVGQLTGGIAHDFNNLLTVMLGSAEALADEVPAGTSAAHLAGMIEKAAGRAADLTQRLLAFSRRQTLSPRHVDVNALVEGMKSLISRTLGENIEITLRLEEGLPPTFVDANQLETALLNLAVNARDAMPDGGKLVIETGSIYHDETHAALNPDILPGEYVMLMVKDSGAGMPPEVMARAFEPFFTTKEVGKGTGLGLSMIYGFVRQSGGHVKLESEIGRGTAVRIFLPRTAEKAAAADPAHTRVAEAPRGSETVLLVEDDAMVRSHLTRTLAGLGYQVIEAVDARAALAAMDEGLRFHLLLSDVIMPGGMNGAELAEAAMQRRPGLKVLLTSGYAASAMGPKSPLARGLRLLAKPYRASDIAREVRAALDAPAPPLA